MLRLHQVVKILAHYREAIEEQVRDLSGTPVLGSLCLCMFWDVSVHMFPSKPSFPGQQAATSTRYAMWFAVVFCSFWALVRGVTKDRCHLLLRLFGEQLGRPGPRGCFAATDPVGEVRDLPDRRWKHHGGGGHAGLEETHGHSGTVSGQNGRWPKCGSLVTTKCGQGLLSPSVTETKLPGLFLRWSNKNILKKNMDLVAESGCRSMRMQPQTVGSCKKKHGPMVFDLELCNSCGFFWRGARTG